MDPPFGGYSLLKMSFFLKGKTYIIQKLTLYLLRTGVKIPTFHPQSMDRAFADPEITINDEPPFFQMDEKTCKCMEPDRQGRYRLLSASKRGHHECVKTLCAKIAKLNLTSDYSLGEALIEASERGHIETMEVLMQAGIDANFILKYGCYAATPLLRACAGGHIQAVELLLNSGAETDLASLENKSRTGSPLVTASFNGHTAIVKLLLSRGALPIDEALCVATERGYFDIVDALLQGGANSNCSKTLKATSNGFFLGYNHEAPVLMEAVHSAQYRITQLLIQWGADVNHSIAADSYFGRHYITGYTGRDKNRYEKWLLIMKLLLLHGADARNATFTIHTGMEISALTIAIHHIANALKWGGYDIEMDQQSVIFIYAAGTSQIIKQFENRHRSRLSIQAISWLNNKHSFSMTSLADLCRNNIRSYLLDPAGGNNKNLFIAVPNLPLPQKLKQFLLFDRYVHSSSKPLIQDSINKIRSELLDPTGGNNNNLFTAVTTYHCLKN